jgi:hypothetical protein
MSGILIVIVVLVGALAGVWRSMSSNGAATNCDGTSFSVSSAASLEAGSSGLCGSRRDWD